MKTLITAIVATALIAPTMASAQRVTTPGTAERHAAAQAKAEAKKSIEKRADRRADNDTRKNLHINGAKAGKVNLATQRSGEGA